jgi:hypothetical protein
MSNQDPPLDVPTRIVQDVMRTLLLELLDGPPGDSAFTLNRGDRGLVASLEALPSAAASARPGGRSSVAAHVEHLRYGLELRNRWARGEDPWATANWSASWTRQSVSEQEWQARRDAFAHQARAWLAALDQPRAWTQVDLLEALSTTVHLAYHMGAIRQIAEQASGPPAHD